MWAGAKWPVSQWGRIAKGLNSVHPWKTSCWTFLDQILDNKIKLKIINISQFLTEVYKHSCILICSQCFPLRCLNCQYFRWNAEVTFYFCKTVALVFRWFKCKLKPPNSMVIENFFLAIWDTSHWNFFCQIWTQDTLWHLRGPFLVNFDMSIFGDSRAIQVICQNWVPSENQFFFDEGATSRPQILLV